MDQSCAREYTRVKTRKKLLKSAVATGIREKLRILSMELLAGRWLKFHDLLPRAEGVSRAVSNQ
jgi:hypothetical protein